MHRIDRLVNQVAVVLLVASGLSCSSNSDQRQAGPDASTPDIAPTTPPVPVIASTDATAAVPSFVWADPALKGAMTSQGITSPELAARAHLRMYAPIYRMGAHDVDALELRDLQDIGRGPIIARFARRVDGVEVWNEMVSVAMSRQLDAIALTGYTTGDVPAAMKSAARGFVLSSGRAAAIALADASGTAVAQASLASPRAGAGGYEEIDSAATASPMRVKKTWFRGADRALTDAYYVEVDLGDDAAGHPRYHSYVVSATTGTIHFKNDLTANHPITYRVWADTTPGQLPVPFDGPQGNATTPLPGGLANGFTAPFVAPVAITLSSLTGLGVDDPWLPPGATETLGNNVDAYVDLVAPDGFTPGQDFRADVTAPDTFDRVFDTAIDANANANQQKAAITQLFYNVNFWHDWYYVAGFDEQAGNAQAFNYGRGGVQGDAIRGEVQDVSGKNNATMQTPADGARPRMQMFLWDFNSASLTVTSPTPATFTTLGLPSGWGATNFTIPNTTAIVRGFPTDGCSALTGVLTGTIVLLDRGVCGFSVKAASAQAAGAAGVIIANVAASANPTVAPGMALTVGQTPPTIAAFSVNLADGNTLRSAVAAGPVTGGMARAVALRDSAIDNQIMAHEWGHYISNRLVFNANGLGTNMARGLGEGWADTHAMVMTVRAGDDLEPTNATWNGVYSASGYAGISFSKDNPFYFGIRRYPYSTDMTKNPLTFKHISDANPLPVGPPINAGSSVNSEVHNTGEVWAAMLWECYAALLRDTQGGAARLTFDQARDRWRDYLVAAYKLTPANPTLLEARDALLAAALATDAADHVVFAQAFAKRGAGVFAVAPDRNSATNTPVTEDFNAGGAIVATSAVIADNVAAVCNADDILDNGETATVTITFRNIGSVPLTAATATISSTTAGISFPAGTTITIPAAAPFQTVTATIRVAATGLAAGPALFDLTITAPDLGAGPPPAKTFTLLGNHDVVPGSSFIDTVEAAPRTTLQVVNTPTTLGATETWHVATVAADDHRWSGPSAAQAGTTDLVSPTMFILPGQPLVITFRHRYSFEVPVFDGGVIEISSDGGVTWTDVGQAVAGYNGTLGTSSGNPIGGRPAYVNVSPGFPAFVTQTLDLGTTFSGRINVRFRVGSDLGTSSPGWDVDNIQVSGISAPPFEALFAQPATCNNAPVANAGLPGTFAEFTPSPVFGPVTATLDGSASFDADGNALTFQWLQLGGPAVTLGNSTARTTTFTAPTVPRNPNPTTLVFQLTVSDGTTSSSAVTQIAITNLNRPPVALVGPTQIVDERTLVTLDGSASSDPDSDDTITFAWTQTAGPTVTLSSSTAAQPTFTGPDVTADTTLSFRLVVSDGLRTSVPVTVTVTLRDTNQAPVAVAGAAQTVPELTPVFGPVTVTLDATASVDPDGNPLTFAWTQVGGPAVTLDDAAVAQPAFTAPSVPRAGTTVLTFAVVATDATLSSVPATTTVTVTNVNRPPVAGAGSAQTVDERTLATLDGTASTDPDTDDTLTFAWTQIAGPPVTLSSPTAAQPTFTAPDVAGDTDLTFALVVDDGLDTSATSSVTITVDNVNRAPVANAGAAQTVAEGAVVTLAGTATDPDGDAPLTFAWSQIAGPTVTLSSPTAAQPTFTAPDITTTTSFTFTLVVSDPATATSAPSTVTITVIDQNRPPVANAGTAAIVRSGQLVALMGSATDPDADIHFAWAWTAPAGITLSDPTSATPTFVAPAVTADTPLELSLVVTDSLGAASSASTVTITVKRALNTPVANAGSAVITSPSVAVALDGSQSSDPDGLTLTHQWMQTGGPPVALTGETTPTPSFTTPAVTDDTALTFQLVVTNSEGVVSSPATVSVFVRITPPPDDSGGCCTTGRSASSGQLLLAGLPLLVILRKRRRALANAAR